MTKVIDDRKKVSRSMCESLYYMGITEGFLQCEKGSVNILKLALDLMEKRVVIAKEMISILSLLISNEPRL